MSQPEAPVPNTPPGWFPDPAGMQTLRWYDGTNWTDHLAPMPVREAIDPPRKKSNIPLVLAITLICAFIVIMILVAVGSSAESKRQRDANNEIDRYLNRTNHSMSYDTSAGGSGGSAPSTPFVEST